MSIHPRLAGLKIAGAEVYGPEPLGKKDIYCYDGRIISVGTDAPSIPGVPFALVDGSGMVATPGFIDSHLHFTGGGGGGAGPISREPDFGFAEVVRSGITTAVGCPGADYMSRSMTNLLQKARHLEAEGLNTYFWSSGYSNPSITLTDSMSSDMMLIDKILGAKIAVSDFMAPPWTPDQLHHLLWQVLSGAQMAAKRGVVHVHSGVLPSAIDVVNEVVERYEYGEHTHWASMHGGGGSVATHFQITHVNWTEHLLSEVVKFALQGGVADVTAGLSPKYGVAQAILPSEAVIRMLDSGVPASNITVSSDSGGSISHGHPQGELDVIRIRPPKILEVFQELARHQAVDLETAARVCSTNVADLHGWHETGRFKAGARGDILLFNPGDFELKHVVVGGELVVADGEPIRHGITELIP